MRLHNITENQVIDLCNVLLYDQIRSRDLVRSLDNLSTLPELQTKNEKQAEKPINTVMTRKVKRIQIYQN